MEAVNYYSDEVKAFEKIRDSRWRNGVACPHCNSDKVRFVSSRLIWQCNGCRKQFSAKTGTIFEDSPIKLSKWLIAMWLIANAKNGISSYELHRSIGVTQKTAWFMLHRIRLALQNGSIEMLKGEVEADETYVGGIAKFMHYTKRQQRGKMVGSAGKTTVVGAIERGGKAVAKIVEVPNTKTLTNFILSNVETDSKLYTDQHGGYNAVGLHFEHQVINHAIEYVRENVHTNSMENFWSLLKRSLKGTYISVEPYHLAQYVGEQVFRFNHRKDNDSGRFNQVVSQVTGLRLTYAQLTGKVLATA